MQEYTAIVRRAGDWWVGWVAGVPGVNCQERSSEELLDTLTITLHEALEFSRRAARAAAGEGYTLEKVVVATSGAEFFRGISSSYTPQTARAVPKSSP